MRIFIYIRFLLLEPVKINVCNVIEHRWPVKWSFQKEEKNLHHSLITSLSFRSSWKKYFFMASISSF